MEDNITVLKKFNNQKNQYWLGKKSFYEGTFKTYGKELFRFFINFKEKVEGKNLQEN